MNATQKYISLRIPTRNGLHRLAYMAEQYKRGWFYWDQVKLRFSPDEIPGQRANMILRTNGRITQEDIYALLVSMIPCTR